MTRPSLAWLLLLASCGAFAASADPFRPPRDDYASEPAVRASGPRLESILIAPNRRIAVISGQQYTEGEKYDDGRVLRISENEVVIRRAGRDELLQLVPQDSKRPGGATQGD